MSEQCVLNIDLAKLYKNKGRKGYLHTLGWGDYVEVLDKGDRYIKVNHVEYEKKPDGSILPKDTEAFISIPKDSGLTANDIVIPRKDNEVLKVNFVDVQQGDAAIIESPDGKIILVDGGENQLFARYLATRYRGTTDDAPKRIDCMVVSHGDSDHLAGLNKIHKSEKNRTKRKRLFIAPERIYHNGLVKRPGKVPEKQRFGKTVNAGDETIITDLVDDPRNVPTDSMNKHFKDWVAALDAWEKRSSKMDIRRLKVGDDKRFNFFNNRKMSISVLGPITTKAKGSTGLKFLSRPSKSNPGTFTGVSASHTVNGHSVVLRLTYGNVNFLFTGDMNDQSCLMLEDHCEKRGRDLKSEILKVPHHGSGDFSPSFLKSVAPMVSIVSSGDESVQKEHIHPRACLVGALGKYSRLSMPLVFVTEMVAFFKMEDWSRLTSDSKHKKRGKFFGFSRAAFGIVKTRTDGKRLLVYTNSGKADMKESYAFTISENGRATTAKLKRV